MFLAATRRILAREKYYVAINIVSLMLGIGCFAILSLYLRNELTYDRHHTNHEQLYRLITKYSSGFEFARVPEDLGPMLQQENPDLGKVARLYASSNRFFSHDNTSTSWDDVFLAEHSVLEVFTHDVIAGDLRTALTAPDSIAISESVARAYFGGENAIGQTLESETDSYRVDLVFADFPANTHMPYDILLPYEDRYPDRIQLESNNVFTFFLVTDDFDLATFPDMFLPFMERYMPDRFRRDPGSLWVELQALTDIHYGEALMSDMPYGNRFYLYGYSAVALFILLIAGINYINLSTARASKRANEIAMRKVLGASRPQLIRQFLGESLFYAAAALVFTLLFIPGVLDIPVLASLLNREEMLASLKSPTVLAYIAALALGVGVISGLYPAFYLSQMPVMGAIKKAHTGNRHSLILRQVLIFVQLTISIGVIACTLLMLRQLSYIDERPLGFDKHNKLQVVVRGADTVDNLPVLRNRLSGSNAINDVTWMAEALGDPASAGRFHIEDDNGVIIENGMAFDILYFEPGFTELLRIDLVAGRRFNTANESERNSTIIVNQSLVDFMGWREPLGKRIRSAADPNGPFRTVIGVTENSHHVTLHDEVPPVLLIPMSGLRTPPALRNTVERTVLVDYQAQSQAEARTLLNEALQELDPEQQIEITTLEESLRGRYRQEDDLMVLTGIFAVICIFISTIGLCGLAAFNAEQRSKEMSIHRILGASSSRILLLLSSNTLTMLLAAAGCASMLSFYTMQYWLQGFAYRAEVTAAPFLYAFIIVTVVTLLAVALQSLNIVRGNPVSKLRYE